MSEKVCAVCGKVLSPSEIRINEMSRRAPSKRVRYLCTRCRKIEYEQYVKAIKDLVEKS